LRWWRRKKGRRHGYRTLAFNEEVLERDIVVLVIACVRGLKVGRLVRGKLIKQLARSLLVLQ
jgi:hypothetical protein